MGLYSTAKSSANTSTSSRMSRGNVNLRENVLLLYKT